LPSGDDKLVQATVKLILERIYEPAFHASSHGFRPGRSCHTALDEIKRTWTGVKWLIEMDIQSFFDTIDHDVVLALLEKRIDDRRFIDLIRRLLRAGNLEDWVYHATYSGTPQGGVVTPPTIWQTSCWRSR
jgi:RNA-directed DNA polymerase